MEVQDCAYHGSSTCLRILFSLLQWLEHKRLTRSVLETCKLVLTELSGNENLVTSSARIINVALGLLGIIAVVIILAGGFKWMTAGGNEDKVAEARKLIFAGIIGLAIILSAWAIARFVIENLATATNSGQI